MMLETKSGATFAARVILIIIDEMRVHMKTEFVNIEKSFVAKGTDFDNLFDMHELVQLLVNLAADGGLSANSTTKLTTSVRGGSRRGS